MTVRGDAVFNVLDVEGEESEHTMTRTTYERAMREAARLMNDKAIVNVDVDFVPDLPKFNAGNIVKEYLRRNA